MYHPTKLDLTHHRVPATTQPTAETAGQYWDEIVLSDFGRSCGAGATGADSGGTRDFCEPTMHGTKTMNISTVAAMATDVIDAGQTYLRWVSAIEGGGCLLMVDSRYTLEIEITSRVVILY